MENLVCADCGGKLCNFARSVVVDGSIHIGVVPCRECLGRSYEKGLAANNTVITDAELAEAVSKNWFTARPGE